jgi:hypothetical protein
LLVELSVRALSWDAEGTPKVRAVDPDSELRSHDRLRHGGSVVYVAGHQHCGKSVMAFVVPATTVTDLLAGSHPCCDAMKV